MELRGATVLVTGGSRGIGAAMARRFASAGARVVVAARNAEALAAVAAEVGGHAEVVDLANPDEAEALVPRVEAAVGPVDVLVNNAGLETAAAFAAVEPAVIRDVVAVNLLAPLLLTRTVLPGMIRRGRGHLVFTSSLAGTAGFPELAAYSATKAGLNNFVAALRLELSSTPIGTTIVAPGPVDTTMWDNIQTTYAEAMMRRLRQLQLIPVEDPDKVARNTVAAVAKGRRHVRSPKRLALTYMLGESPRRIAEALLVGVRFDPAVGAEAGPASATSTASTTPGSTP